MNPKQPTEPDFLVQIGKGILNFGLTYVKSSLQQANQDHEDLVQLGTKLGVQYVPGEDLSAYRAKVIAARDAKLGG